MIRQDSPISNGFIRTVTITISILLLNISLSSLICFAQDQEGEDNSDQELTVYQKVLRWARPNLQVTEIDEVIEEVELNSSRFGVDMDFSIALVAAEASLQPTQAFSRQWSSLMELKRSYAFDSLNAPAILDDIPNAISTIREMIDETRSLPHFSDRTLRNALARYWMGPAKGQNVDSFERFYNVFKEKYKSILVAQNKQYAIGQAGMPVIPDDISGFISKLPRMSELDSRIKSWKVEGAYVEAIQNFNPKLDDSSALLIARTILSFSADAGIDPRLVVALIEVESGFNPKATSKKGAMGLGQLMPATAKGYGIIDPYEPVQNIWVCVRYLEREFYRYRSAGNSIDLVLAAYNAGPGAVKKYGGVPPYKETQRYVSKVKAIYQKLLG